jgi:predicted RND superfamily exporter protein
VRETLLRNLARVCAHGYRWVFAGALVVAASVVALFVLRPPHIESDILDLLPQKNPVVQDFRMATGDFKSLDYLFVVLETTDPSGHPIDGYEDFADAFAEALRKSKDIDGVEYRLQDYEPIIQEMLPYTLLYLDPKDLGEVAERFTDARIRAQVAFNRQMLGNPASLFTKQLVQYDPFGLLPIIKRHFMGQGRQLEVDLSDGYYISKDGSALIMVVRPSRPAQDIPFGRSLMAEVRGIEARLRDRWKEEEGDSADFLKVEYGGGYPIAQDDANLIKRDALVNTVTSIVLVMIVFIWAFKKRSALVYGWLPLIFGLLLTFGTAHLLGVTLNSATAGFGALLIGLGIDFSTVMYGRYTEERNRGMTTEESIASVMGNTGKGVLVGAVTTACTFGAMLVTSFNGMRQVGIFTSLGILFCAASVFVLLPAMLYFHHLHKTRRGEEPTFHMSAFGLDRLGLVAHRHPVWTLAVTGALTLGLGFAATGVRLEDNVQNLRSPKNRGINVSMEVAKKFGASLTYMMAVVDADSADGVVVKSDKVLASVKPFLSSGEVVFTDSLSTYLPPRARQEAVIRALKDDPEGKFSYDRIRATFLSACERNGFDPEYFKPYLERLQRMLEPEGPVTYEQLSRSSLGPILRKYIVEKSPGHFRGVVYMYIPEEYKRFEPKGLEEAVHREAPDAKVVGINLLSQTLRGQVKRDALLAFVVGSIVAFLIIVADFRAVWPALMSILPLGVGLLWMLGCLRLMGEPLNMMNIFVTTMIIGIGSDYGIYFVHRYLEDDGHHMERVIRETGTPIVIAALTTIAGFGSMSLSSYPGLRSMGYVSLLGTLYCMAATLTVLVAILTLTEKRKG